MTSQRRANDSMHWFMNDLTSRIVAESGIPTDRYHLGKIILQSLKDAPDVINQVDGGTGQWETNLSVMQRSVQCAVCFRNMGLKTGDVVVLMAPNHLDLVIPFYAALYLGLIIAAVDRTLGLKELQATLDVSQPKVIFCQSDKATDAQLAVNNSSIDSVIISFDRGDYLFSFSEFLEKYGDDCDLETFRPADFDPSETIAFLISTSGTTGFPKAAAPTYKNFSIMTPYLWGTEWTFPSPTKIALIGSPLQWLTALVNFVTSTVLRYVRLQTSHNMTQEHAYHIINLYKPTYTVLSPTFMTTLIRPEDRARCDFSCFDLIFLGGSAVPSELIEELKTIMPNTEVRNAYGMSELCSIAFFADIKRTPGSCGVPMGCFQYRLIDINSMDDILEPNNPGELWIKGPGVFKEYYRNPEATEEAFAEDRWFKTGDLFYRDEHWCYFFVERIKLLLKYKSYQISPVEVESVIRQHPSVVDVAVTSIPDAESGDLPVACVVVQKGDATSETAKEIKRLVEETLSDAKRLRGGVLFVDSLPITASTKVHRRKLKEMALTMERI